MKFQLKIVFGTTLNGVPVVSNSFTSFMDQVAIWSSGKLETLEREPPTKHGSSLPDNQMMSLHDTKWRQRQEHLEGWLAQRQASLSRTV